MDAWTIYDFLYVHLCEFLSLPFFMKHSKICDYTSNK